MGEACSTHWTDGKCVKYFGHKNLKGRDHSEDLGVDGRIILELILGKQGGNLWSGFIWLRIESSGGLL
jgi:hypothetical protein